jgi:peroxiredoxin family protein
MYYAALVMANGALMEGMQAKDVFLHFFGLEAITKKKCGSSTYSKRLVIRLSCRGMPTVVAGLPGFEAFCFLHDEKRNG